MKKDLWDKFAIIGAILTGIGTCMLGYGAIYTIPTKIDIAISAVDKFQENVNLYNGQSIKSYQTIQKVIDELDDKNAKLDIKLHWQDPQGRELLFEKYNLKLDQSKIERLKALPVPEAESTLYNLLQQEKLPK